MSTVTISLYVLDIVSIYSCYPSKVIISTHPHLFYFQKYLEIKNIHLDYEAGTSIIIIFNDTQRG